MRIFITGATGFLGSNLVMSLTQYGFKLLCLKRSFSDIGMFKRLSNIQWVDVDRPNWKRKVRMFNPEIVIHTAWIGVSAKERADESIQTNNIGLIEDVLDVSKDAFKFIGFGSQDEYGYLDKVVDEDAPLHPISPYGKIKVKSADIVSEFCAKRDIDWYWMRIFSVYGRGNRNSVIQQVVEKINTDSTMGTTLGEQEYAFLHVWDFCNAIYYVIIRTGSVGIYNLSSRRKIRLKDLFLKVKEIYNPAFVFKFGVVSYRSNQSILIQGDSSKFIREFGHFEKINLLWGLRHY